MRDIRTYITVTLEGRERLRKVSLERGKKKKEKPANVKTPVFLFFCFIRSLIESKSDHLQLG